MSTIDAAIVEEKVGPGFLIIEKIRQAQMVMQDLAEPFEGCLVLSNCKVYVFKILGRERYDLEWWI